MVSIVCTFFGVTIDYCDIVLCVLHHTVGAAPLGLRVVHTLDQEVEAHQSRVCQCCLIDLVRSESFVQSLLPLDSDMPRTSRRRKLPVTLTNAEKNGSSSTPRASRTVIRGFHTLLKQRKCAQGDALANIDREIEALGGLEGYQRMSCIGQGSDRGGGSEKVLIGWLKQMGWADKKDEAKHR